jgi:hypothetical protein
VKVELKECMALGDEYCRHIVRSNRVKWWLNARTAAIAPAGWDHNEFG